MLTLAPDPGVPQRDALLSAATVGRLLGARVERVYAKYRVGESLRVVHRVGGNGHVAARSFSDGASAAAYERALAAAVPSGALPPVIHAPELDAVFWTFPNDRRIDALPLLDPRSPALADLLGRACAQTRLTSYAAERAASAACVDAHGRVFAYGPRQRPDMAFRRFCAAAVAGRPIELFGDGRQTRDFTFVADVVAATRAAAAAGSAGGRVYNVGGGARVSLNSALERLAAIAGRPLDVRRRGREDGDVRHTGADIARARADLGFAPTTSLEQGLAAEFEWVLARGAVSRPAAVPAARG